MVQISNRLKLAAKVGSEPVSYQAMQNLKEMGETPYSKDYYKNSFYFFEDNRNRDIYASEQYFHKFDEMVKIAGFNAGEKEALQDFINTTSDSYHKEYAEGAESLLKRAEQLKGFEGVLNDVKAEAKENVIQDIKVIAGHLQHVEKEKRLDSLSGPDTRELNEKTRKLMTDIYGYSLKPEELAKKVEEFNKTLTDSPTEALSLLEVAKESLDTGKPIAQVIAQSEGIGGLVDSVDIETGNTVKKWDPNIKSAEQVAEEKGKAPEAPKVAESTKPQEPAAKEAAALSAMKKIKEEYLGKDGSFKLERGYSKGQANADVAKFQDLLQSAGIIEYTEGQPYKATDAKDVRIVEGKIQVPGEDRGHNMGAITEEATKELQKKMGLEVTGVFGEKEFHAAYALVQSKGDVEAAKQKYASYNAAAEADRAMAGGAAGEKDKKTVDNGCCDHDKPLVFNAKSVDAALKGMGAKEADTSAGVAAAEAGQKQRVEGVSGPALL